ncbi:MAG TPA: hypothetical protein VIM57_10615 [Luteolibacter sp.]
MNPIARTFARLLAIAPLATALYAAPEYASAPSSAARFPTPFSPDLPFDVNIDQLRALSETPQKPQPPFTIPDDNVPSAQRLFDIFAWQSFLALNWPANADGMPDKSKTLADSTAPRVWEGFTEISQVFRENGAAPLPWKDAVKQSWSNRTFWMHGMGEGTPPDEPNKPGGINPPLLDESLQAFTGPMIDQQGKWVRYQVALNQVEYDYLVENKLYNLEGQAAFTAKQQIDFPANKGTTKHGAMEIKMAWKQMSDQDDRARFFVRHAKVIPLTGKPFEADFGLVGMHVSVRTESSPTWIWATFEHVDNVAVNDLEKGANGKPLRPTFFNPDNPAKPVNILAAKNAAPVPQYNPKTGKDDGPIAFTSWDESKTTDPTQTLMVLPVPKATNALNAEVRGLLKGLGSVFQYYELIGTQWPVAPSFPAFPNGVAAQPDGRLLPSSTESILFKIPGKVVPVHLINTTMETFFQNGNQPAGPLAEDDRLPPGLLANPATVFATESCAGCHFSAGACIAFKKDNNGKYLVQQKDGKNYRIPIFGKNAVRGMNGNADYSWLLQLRAQSAPYEGTDISQLNDYLIAPGQKVCPANTESFITPAQ